MTRKMIFNSGNSLYSGINLVLFVLAFAILGMYVTFKSFAASETNPQTTWAMQCSATSSSFQQVYSPLSDSAAAALVTHQPEVRPYNDKPYSINGVSYPGANEYVPTDAELAAFRSAKNQYNQTPQQFNYYLQFTDGKDGLSNPSTDDLIQWGAHKWGIPEDWLRAEYVLESSWSQFQLGDQHTETTSWYPLFPVQSRVPNTPLDVYQSLGITQIQWTPDNALGIGAEPLRWESTAFNIDFQGAMLRFFYDNPLGERTTWGDSSYVPCQQWNSIGGWFSPYPWNNSGQQNYISIVQSDLSDRIWTTSSFINTTLPFPSAISFNTTSCSTGDFNCDGHVNVFDLSIFLSHWQQSGSGVPEDLNNDGIVNIFDLSILLSHYGT